jgi:RNA polymerase sigma factor for flagellar operon FliA
MGLAIEEVDEILLSAKSAGHTSIDEDTSSALFEKLSDPHSDDPQGSAEWLETKLSLELAINAFPEQDRTVITLYYGEELLLREIAEVLGVTERTVRRDWNKARLLLMSALKT